MNNIRYILFNFSLYTIKINKIDRKVQLIIRFPFVIYRNFSFKYIYEPFKLFKVNAKNFNLKSELK